MIIIQCTMEHLDAASAFYDEVTEYLNAHINYPKWTPHVYPGRESTKAAIAQGTQYLCMEEDAVVGGFILNDDPQGAYELGDWKLPLSLGEFLIIHTLAVSPSYYGKGIGKCMVEYCIYHASTLGYKALRLDVVPGNYPAEKLYLQMGFTFAGERDLLRNIEGIPTFKLYEKIL